MKCPLQSWGLSHKHEGYLINTRGEQGRGSQEWGGGEIPAAPHQAMGRVGIAKHAMGYPVVEGAPQPSYSPRNSEAMASNSAI